MCLAMTSMDHGLFKGRLRQQNRRQEKEICYVGVIMIVFASHRTCGNGEGTDALILQS